MRVIVSGSRKWKLPAIEIISRLERIPRPFTLIHGGGDGADQIAHEWALERFASVKIEVHAARWGKHGPQAGPIRNQQMADSGADLLLAFPLENSRGTWDMIRRAKSAGIKIEVIRK